jgi:hypothetical protein
MAAKCFVLSGRCSYLFDDVRFELTEGDYWELPSGKYSVQDVGESGCNIVLVFKYR